MNNEIKFSFPHMKCEKIEVLYINWRINRKSEAYLFIVFQKVELDVSSDKFVPIYVKKSC